MDRVRHNLFLQLLTQLTDVEGSIVECGVFHGDSLSYLAALARALGKPRAVWGYDAFGLPIESIDELPVFPAPDMAVVLDALEQAGWNTAKDVHLIKGLFAESLVAHPPPAPIALLHLDADLYQSYKDVLRILWPGVALRGIVILDEYLSPKWIGAKKAVDEFLVNHKDAQLRLDTRAYLVKEV